MGKLRLVLGALALTAATMVSPVPSGAAQATGVPLPLDGLGRISPELAGIRLESPQLARAVAARTEAERALADAQDRGRGAEARMAELETLDREITTRLEAFGAAEQRAARELEAAQKRLREVAVTAYMNGGSAHDLAVLLDSEDGAEAVRRQRILAAVHDDQRDASARMRAARDRASALVTEAVADREATRREIGRTLEVRLEAQGDERRWIDELDRRRQAIVEAAPLAIVSGTDLPLVTLDAYWRAARTASSESPSCAIRWTAVAGIGKIESKHGTYRGAAPDELGDVTPEIIGIPLDGTNETLAIGDTDGGALDHDTVVDRAVGPMQFIPSTWRSYAGDGNGDGVSSPHNLYDAALGTARYLCRAAPAPLVTDEALHASFFSYNHSDEYASNVLGWAHAYDAVPLSLASR